ncbi:hypothetical protein Zmor_017177 [Zophobas morio]|uniref:EF-hand domain-containing protein n=1 Tax=Zophobas morio TaxID=2755281 RepID=A0AA38IBY1_9CUCU|nr:hypothetical protein Zmor_017177 [Zophobas morio]
MDTKSRSPTRVPIQNDGDENIPLTKIQTSRAGAESYYKNIFDEADIDHDGYITIQELCTMINNNHLTEKPIPSHIVRKIHQVADINHDGRLDYREFVDMLNDPKNYSIFERYVTKYVNFVVPRRQPEESEEPYLETIYEEEYSCWPPRLGMVIISCIEIIFFFIDELKETNSTNSATGPMAKLFIYDPVKRYEFWRYLTYMFVHIGYSHLVYNLVVQIFIGIPLEMVHGWWRVLLIYFAGVIAGSLGTSITNPTFKLAGASGGVYSLVTAHIATIIMNWAEMSFPVIQLIIFIIITGGDFSISIYNRYWVKEDEQTGYAAHVTGALAGLLVGIVVLRNLKLTKKENVMWWIAVAIYMILMLVGICWNLFYTDYFPKQD